MTVLLLRLAGPMQSWGTQSRFSVRDTGREPSRSGVIGLLCASLGWPRSTPLDDLAPEKLRMAVRVDREGLLARDYHTAGGSHRKDELYGVVRASVAQGKKIATSDLETVVSSRYYLDDADFLVGLEGEPTLLDQLDAALRRPIWPLFLGRKAFVPGLPVALAKREDAIHEGSLLQVLQNYPWRKRFTRDQAPATIRFVEEVDYGQGEPRQDVPLSFEKRRFTLRHVQIGFLPDLDRKLTLPPILDPEFSHVSQPTDAESAPS